MNCPQCGASNPDNATTCVACGASLSNPYRATGTPPTSQERINNYLIPAVLSTLCCCLPFGIVSIIYAAQVNGKLAGGDVEGARRAADSAKMWFWIAFGLGLVVNALAIVGQIILAISQNPNAFK